MNHFTSQPQPVQSGLTMLGGPDADTCLDGACAVPASAEISQTDLAEDVENQQAAPTHG